MGRKNGYRRNRDRESAAGNHKIRYAVVGLGGIAQIAVLPAFKHAKNSQLTALVSEDPTKQTVIGKRLKVRKVYSYEQYDECLASGEVDAVYIALPNHMHADFSIAASRAGVHVLCEKPMAMTENECHDMIDAARQAGVKLMIAYRLHFEEGTWKRSGLRIRVNWENCGSSTPPSPNKCTRGTSG